eukprot:SM000051S17575  [mRNA]  locus=s51:449680:450171:- [translate_table: standard]
MGCGRARLDVGHEAGGRGAPAEKGGEEAAGGVGVVEEEVVGDAAGGVQGAGDAADRDAGDEDVKDAAEEEGEQRDRGERQELLALAQRAPGDDERLGAHDQDVHPQRGGAAQEKQRDGFPDERQGDGGGDDRGVVDAEVGDVAAKARRGLAQRVGARERRAVR